MDFNYSSFKRRLAAFLIDSVIVWVVFLVLVFSIFRIFVPITDNTPTTSQGIAMFLLFVALSWIYPIVFVGAFQKTIGMHLLKIKVLREDGSRVSYLRAFVRELVSRFLAAFTLGIAWLWIIWDSKKQGWHDKIAKTFVVKSK